MSDSESEQLEMRGDEKEEKEHMGRSYSKQSKGRKYKSPESLMKYGDTRGLGVMDFPPPKLTDYAHHPAMKSDTAPLHYDDPMGHEMAYLIILNATQRGEQKTHVDVFHQPLYRVAFPSEGGVYQGGEEFYKAQEKIDVMLGRVPLRDHSLDYIPKVGEIDRDAVLPPLLPSPDTLSIFYDTHPMALN